jgi:hypothetical protein
MVTVCMVPPEGFEPSHLAPEASALSPELWGLSNAERLSVHGTGCDTRGAHARPASLNLRKML